jgi:hypothetical protein
VSRTVARILFVAIAAAILASILYLQSCQAARQQGAQSRVDRGQTEALGNSAADAIATQGAAAARERASEDLGRTNEREIRNAKGANAPVDPAARDAGLRSLCRRAAYRESERCRLLGADPR